MSSVNEKVGLGTMFATGVGLGVGAAMGAPLGGAAAGLGGAMLAKRGLGKVKRAMSGPPPKPKNPICISVIQAPKGLASD